MNGIIFDIQRFSVYDGKGIRTNFFFKGCNLRCKWCHNPESQKKEPQLMFNKNKCTGCGECVRVCANTFTENCTACGRCTEVCKYGARKIAGKEYSVDEVFNIVVRDKAFYDTSGGGVTLSGGEPLLQIDFTVELLKKCKENGINTAVETAANVPWEYFEKVLPYLDTVLCDVKCIDESRHRELTGVSNKQILANAEKLMQSGKEVIFRMPVIPGLNDCEVERVREFTKGFVLELLAYHETGKGKYEQLNMDYTVSAAPPAAEAMTALAEKIGAIYAPTGI